MALRFAELGSTLVLWDINKEANEETAAEVRRFKVAAYCYICDLSSRDDIYKAADQVGDYLQNGIILFGFWFSVIVRLFAIWTSLCQKVVNIPESKYHYGQSYLIFYMIYRTRIQ